MCALRHRSFNVVVPQQTFCLSFRRLARIASIQLIFERNSACMPSNEITVMAATLFVITSTSAFFPCKVNIDFLLCFFEVIKIGSVLTDVI